MSRVKIRRHRSAFTLIELLLVLVILAVLASIVVLNFNSIFGQSDTTKAKSDIHQLSTAIEMFHTQLRTYPSSLNELVTNNGSPDWHGPYIQRGIPTDPWGHPYIYAFPGSHNQDSFDLSSNGDGKKVIPGLDNWTPDAVKN
jgi:general secretion pathway protein G